MTLRAERVGFGVPTDRPLVPRWLEWLAAFLPKDAPAPTWRGSARRHLMASLAYDALVTWSVVVAVVSGYYGTGVAALYGVAAMLGFVLTLAACRGYRTQDIAAPGACRSIIRTAGVLVFTSLALEYFQIVAIPSAVMLPTLVLTIALAVIGRLVMTAVVRRRRAHGALLRRTLLVGHGSDLDDAFGAAGDAAAHGLTVLGRCAPVADEQLEPGVLGDYTAIPRLVEDLSVDVVVVSADAMSAHELRRLGWTLQERRTELYLLPPLADVGAHRIHVEPGASTPLLGVSLRTPVTRHWAKEALDRTAGAVLLVLALVIVLPTALLVRLTSPGPAFFAQERIGLDGRPFTMHKLRSMYRDAEARRAALVQHNDGNDMLFKMHDDPRVTPVGRFIRRYSIDELPQLWNVVKGDMSLVGPRPALREEVERYDDVTAHRLAVKPGLTGLWQVSGRSDLSTTEAVRLDLRYVDNWTVGMDLHTLGRTARAVISSDGAY